MNYEDDNLDYYGEEPPFPEATSKYAMVMKYCKVCEKKKRMSTDHGTCESCCQKLEAGWQE